MRRADKELKNNRQILMADGYMVGIWSNIVAEAQSGFDAVEDGLVVIVGNINFSNIFIMLVKS